MRQLGNPPSIDLEIFNVLKKSFRRRDVRLVDASGSTGSKDFLERILELIRSTGFTVVIFSHETRQTAFANIAMELGFAAMCGKPVVIVKSKSAAAPSDLTRSDWIDYDAADKRGFSRKLAQAIDMMADICNLEKTLLKIAMEAGSPDCARALERCNKGFLLSGDKTFLSSARQILKLLDTVREDKTVADLERLRTEVKTFIRQATDATDRRSS